MKIVSNYNKDEKSEILDEIDQELETDMDSIIKKGEQNANSEIDLESVPLEGEPFDLSKLKDKEYNNSIDSDFFRLGEQAHKLTEKIKEKVREVKLSEEETFGEYGQSHEIIFPLTRMINNIKLMNKKLKVISYLTICQMYNGVLINEEVTLRKGKAYQYKHHSEISINNFFKYLYNNKKEVYEKLGYEKSVLIEEIFNRLFYSNVFTINKDEPNEKERLEISGDHYYDDDFYYICKNFVKGKELEEEINKIKQIDKIKLKQPIKITNENRSNEYNYIVITSMIITLNKIIFYGRGVDEEDGEESKLDLGYEEYNYLYKHYEKLINNIICKSLRLLKQYFLIKVENCKALEEKCNKYLLVASISGIDLKEYLRR